MLQQVRTPFTCPPLPKRDEEFVWLKPEIVIEARFLEWTPSGQIRHGVFERLVADKPAWEVLRHCPTS
jgi:bifunctional non-homologous end joining protein LigD